MRLKSFALFSMLCVTFCFSACTSNPPPSTQEQPTASAPATTQQSVSGPVPGTRLTEAYVRQVGRSAYLWAWPMMNVHNRKLVMNKVPEPGLMGGIVPAAPPNQLAMLHDYIVPEERVVACPNQDVVYGLGILDFSQEPAVIQVPDFGDRFWVYQIVDQRTDSFAQVGKMYGTKPGFYLLAGPDWKGTVPSGINGVFHAKTSLGVVIPRVFKDDTPEDLQAVQPVINKIMMYPLSKFTAQQQTCMRLRMPQGSPMASRFPRWVHVINRRRMPTAARTSVSDRRHPQAKKAIGSLPCLAKDISQYSGSMGPQKPPSKRVGSLGISRSNSPVGRARECRVQSSSCSCFADSE